MAFPVAVFSVLLDVYKRQIYDTAKGIDLVVCFMSQNLTDTGAAQSTIAADARAIYGYYNE